MTWNGFRALLRAGMRDLLRRPLLSGLMLLSLALGVAVVIAIDLANQSAQRAFELSTDEVVGQATHRIVGGPSGVPESLYLQIRIQQGIRLSAPVIEGIVTLTDFDYRPISLIGIDPFADLPFREYLDQTAPFTTGFAPFYTEPDTVILPGELAASLGVSPGELLQVQVNDRQQSLRILGLLNQQRSGDVLLMDLAGAQELLGLVGRLSRIDLIADEALAAEIADFLPSGARIQPSSAQVETADQLTSAFRLNLTALSLLALVVGMFLVYNTMTFSVLRRRPVFGILRALGATGAEIRTLIVAEAALIGLIGSGLGIGIGWLLSRSAVGLVSQTINDFYFLVSVRESTLGIEQLLKGFGLGIGAGSLSAVFPAREAASIPPIQVLRRSDLERRTRERLPASVGVGVGAIGLGYALFQASGSWLPGTFFGLMLIVVGIALLVPSGTNRVMNLLPSSRGGLYTRLALRGVSRNISRSGTAIGALMIALSVAIGVTLMIDSFRATVENWLAVTLQSDLYVSSPAIIGTRPQASLPAELPERIERVDGVVSTESLRAVIVESEFGEVHLSAVDTGRARDADLYRFAQGSAAQAWDRVVAGAVIVSESLTLRSGAIDEIKLSTDRGEQLFPVVGIFYDYSTDRGTVLLSSETYRQYWEDPFISSVGVMLADGTAAEQVAEAIRAELAGSGLVVQENLRVRQEALRIFDRTFAITAALRLLAVTVAFVGVLSALLSLQLERSREYATLRALGMTPAGLRRWTFLESALMGGSAALFSFPTGVVMAVALSHIINTRSFGWSIGLELSVAPFVQAAIVGIAAALLAAIYPSLRLERIAVAAALSKE